MKYQCFYNRCVFVDGRAHTGKKILEGPVFDTEAEAEAYARSNDGIQEVSDDYDGEIPYEEDSSGKFLRIPLEYEEVQVIRTKN